MKSVSFLLLALAAGCAEAAVTVQAPADGAVVPLLSDGQKAYVKMPRKERIEYFANQLKRAEMRMYGYYPLPVKLAWSGDGAKFDVLVKRLPDGKEFYKGSVQSNELEICNLEIARGYEWSVSAEDGSSAKASFTTEDIAPRLLKIPGIPNVRDLGGRIGLGGKRVKQNMVFRTAGLNNNAGWEYYTRDELLAKNGSLREVEKLTDVDKAKCKALQKEPAKMKFVDVKHHTHWTYFDMGNVELDAAALTKLSEIPESLQGVPAQMIQQKRGEIRLAKPPTGLVVLMQRVQAAEAGWYSMSARTDRQWELMVNGVTQFDLRNLGDVHHSHQSYSFPVEVKAGENMVVIISSARPGSGRVLTYNIAPADPVAKLLENRIENDRARVRAITKMPKCRKVGAERLTSETRYYMTNTLAIKSDIDLRSSGECWGMTGSPLGDNVTWFHYSSSSYGGMQSDGGKEPFKQVFKVFLDPANYPIDFHCIAGQDRTGAVAFIINGLLGVEEEELYLDWEVTGFWNASTGFNHKDRFNGLVDGFKKYKGDTLNEKIVNYVLGLGFTMEDIEKLRSIMLE